MNLTRRTLALALALTPGIGGRTVSRILTRNDLLARKPTDFLAIGVEGLREEYRVNARGAAAWVARQREMVRMADELQSRLDPLGVRMVTLADATYPSAIEQFDPDPPGILYLYGNERLLESPSVAILSSRQSPPVALERMESLAEEHVLAGRVIVSGHDTPEYQRVAVVPLRWGAPRILVLDTGLFAALGVDLKEEPFRAGRLWRFQFDARSDLVVTGVNPLGKFHRQSNRIRDRILGGLARQIDLVAPREGGNMERMAILALRAGRPVRIDSESELAERLFALGATPLSPKSG